MIDSSADNIVAFQRLDGCVRAFYAPTSRLAGAAASCGIGGFQAATGVTTSLDDNAVSRTPLLGLIPRMSGARRTIATPLWVAQSW
jgi:hypothetical protein